MDEQVGVATSPPVPQGRADYDRLVAGGFSAEEANNWKAQTTQQLMEGGFTPSEVDKHFGDSPPETPHLDSMMKRNMLGLEPKVVQKFADSPLDMLAAGWGMSVTGLSLAGHKPTSIMPQDAGVMDKILYGTGQAAGDIPFMIAGAVAGGGAGGTVGSALPGPGTVVGTVAGAGVGAAALPTALREALLMSYSTGEMSTWRDFAAHAGTSLMNIVKSGAAGLIAAPAGPLAGKAVGAVAGDVAGAIANPVATATAFTGAAGALEGHVPDAADFIAGAALAVGMHAAGKVTETGKFEATESTQRVQRNLQSIYVDTGMQPWKAAELAKSDPKIKDELMSQDVNGKPVMDKLPSLAPEEPAYGLKPEDIIPMWAFFGKNTDQTVMRVVQFGAGSHVVPAPEAIATYMQGFGKLAGFKFTIGEAQTERNEYVNNPHAGTYSLGGEKVTHVYMPSTPEEQLRTWYGLGRSEVLLHEAGHAIDMTVLRPGAIDTPHAPGLHEEMVAVSQQFRPKLWSENPDYNMRPSELMADAVAQYLSNSAARTRMPLFEKQYGKILEPYVEMAGKALPVRNADGTWTGPDGEKVENNTGYGGGGQPPAKPPGEGGGPGEPPEKPKKIEGEVPLKLRAEDISLKWDDRIGVAPQPQSLLNPSRNYRQWVSELGPVRNIDKTLEGLKQGYDHNKNLGLEDMFRQTYASEMRAGYFVRKGVLDPVTMTETSDASIMKAMGQVRADGGNSRDFVKYMLAARTIEKANLGIDTGFPLDQAETLVREWGKHYEKAAAIFQQVNKGALEYGRDSGIFNQNQVDAMHSQNTSYISMRRIMGDDAGMIGGRGRSFRSSNPLRRMEGDDRKVIDPMLATIDNLHSIVKMADRNRAIGSVITLAERHGITEQLGLKKIGAPPKIEIADPGSDLFKPYDVNDATPYEPFLAQRAIRSAKDNQFMYVRDGVPEMWQATSPELAQLMRGADSPGEADIISKTFYTAAAISRASIVTAADFMIRMPLRDQIGTFALDPLKPPPFVTWGKGLMEVFKQGDRYWDWVAKGGAGTALVDMDVKYLARDVHKVFQETGTWGAMWNMVKHPLEAAQLLSERLDAASRVGYKEYAESKGIESLKAATMSRKAYLDFTEKGTLALAQMWSKAVPFRTPSILGMKQFGEAMKERPGTTIALAGLGVTMPQVLLYALNYVQDEYGGLPEDRKYRNLPRWTKDTQFVFPEVQGVRLKMGTPPEIGFLMAGTVTRFLDYFLQNDPKAFDGWAKQALQTYLPPAFPTLLLPPMEHATNYSFGTGRALIPGSLDKVSGDLQYTENTTEPAKKLAAVVGKHGLGIADISPIVMENYVRGYTGTMGMSALKAINATMSTSGKPWEVADIPFVSGFVTRNPGMSAQPIRDFFDEANAATVSKNDAALALKRSKQGADNESELNNTFDAKQVQVTNATKAILLQRDLIIGVNNDKTMTTNEKRQAIDQSYSDMIQTAKYGLEVIRGSKAQ